MRHGSLFSGIGGFDLAAEWMGWENVFHCEIAEFPRRVLNHYWPKSISYADITSTDFTIHRGSIDVLTGGFPCQPYSTAGKRLGKEDARHLWPEMLRVIREIQPAWIVGENVLGLVNWNAGLVFDEVQTDLEAEGYEVQPYVLPAAGVNAPHLRNRIWFVAHARISGDSGNAGGLSSKAAEADGGRTKSSSASGQQVQVPDQSGAVFGDATQDAIGNGRILGEPVQEGAEVREQRNACAGDSERVRGEAMAGDAADSAITRRKKREQNGGRPDTKKDGTGLELWAERFIEHGDAADSDGNIGREGRLHTSQSEQTERYIGTRDACGQHGASWQNFPTEPPVCCGDDGLPPELDGITFSKWRNESIKGYVNAVVPQVVLQIFKAIEAYEHL